MNTDILHKTPPRRPSIDRIATSATANSSPSKSPRAMMPGPIIDMPMTKPTSRPNSLIGRLFPAYIRPKSDEDKNRRKAARILLKTIMEEWPHGGSWSVGLSHQWRDDQPLDVVAVYTDSPQKCQAFVHDNPQYGDLEAIGVPIMYGNRADVVLTQGNYEDTVLSELPPKKGE